jgi:hypothetical protein
MRTVVAKDRASVGAGIDWMEDSERLSRAQLE